MGKITIEDMQFFACHGCFEEEQITGTRFSVDISINTDTTSAESTDDLSQTIDYQAVYNLVKEEMAIPSKLLEHVARRILDRLLREFPAAATAKIKVSKLNPPVGGKIGLVSITLSGENGDKYKLIQKSRRD